MLMSGWKASSATKCVVHMTAPAAKPARNSQPFRPAVFARLGEQEQGDEGTQGADCRGEEHELRIMALQDIVAGDEHVGDPIDRKKN